MIWRNTFQILSSCIDTPERVALRMKEPRSPDLQYWDEPGLGQLRASHTSMTMYILSFLGSLIFWTSWTILRCFSPSNILLLQSAYDLHEGDELTPQPRSASYPSRSSWNNQAASTHIPSHHPLSAPWKSPQNYLYRY